jgi:hypothetical protein
MEESSMHQAVLKMMEVSAIKLLIKMERLNIVGK